MKSTRYRLLALGLMVALAIGACGGGKVIVNQTPTEQQAGEFRTDVKRVADGGKAAVTVIREVASLIDQLPVPDSVKDSVDCSILQVMGSRIPPSERVRRACGGNLPTGPGPFVRALDELEAVTSRPSLCTTAGRVQQAITGLLSRFDESKNQALRMAAVSIRASLAIISSLPCSGTELAEVR